MLPDVSKMNRIFGFVLPAEVADKLNISVSSASALCPTATSSILIRKLNSGDGRRFMGISWNCPVLKVVWTTKLQSKTSFRLTYG